MTAHKSCQNLILTKNKTELCKCAWCASRHLHPLNGFVLFFFSVSNQSWINQSALHCIVSQRRLPYTYLWNMPLSYFPPSTHGNYIEKQQFCHISSKDQHILPSVPWLLLSVWHAWCATVTSWCTSNMLCFECQCVRHFRIHFITTLFRRVKIS